ncbi:MAG: hypothetical protein JO146_00080 [Candidatus Eremiobacteraeota bacterium]|nr:hypothetical protein [Candidatus Eremiobacteraeota bacterium]
MLQNVAVTPSRRSLEFGIYRDGDNNLDRIQESTLSQALQTSARDSRIAFTVEDTTHLRSDGDEIVSGALHTERYAITDGEIGDAHSGPAQNMADESNLARFVAHTLDDAQTNGAKQTWIDLVDHGGGDGGGLETRDGACMSMPDIARAIADGIALHAAAHPDDAQRRIDGVVANQCLMDTLGFADALSRAGVRYLAASPETMLAPGVPSGVAHAIASHEGAPDAMARAVTSDVMRTKYDAGDFGGFAPAAAFDVLDLDPAKIGKAEVAIKRLNDDVASDAATGSMRSALREDVRAIPGMVRFPHGNALPWRADRPAIAVYDTLAGDGRLNDRIRNDALAAKNAVGDLVLAHRESDGFGPFGGADYSDAAGPTIHLPTSRKQIDPWASAGVTETDNAFYRKVDEGKMTAVLA